MEINQLYPQLTSYIIRKILDDKIIKPEKLIFLLQHAKDIDSSNVILSGLNMLLTGKLNTVSESQEPQITDLPKKVKLSKSKQKVDGIVINNLIWDVNNIKNGKEEYFTFEEARLESKKLNKRCPTTKEFEQLLALGYIFDIKKNGLWVAGNYKTDHVGSLFFPAAGLRNNYNGVLASSPGNGYYWSLSPCASGHVYAGSLYFYSGSVNPQYYSNRAYGQSVRCVRDIL